MSPFYYADVTLAHRGICIGWTAEFDILRAESQRTDDQQVGKPHKSMLLRNTQQNNPHLTAERLPILQTYRAPDATHCVRFIARLLRSGLSPKAIALPGSVRYLRSLNGFGPWMGTRSRRVLRCPCSTCVSANEGSTSVADPIGHVSSCHDMCGGASPWDAAYQGPQTPEGRVRKIEPQGKRTRIVRDAHHAAGGFFATPFEVPMLTPVTNRPRPDRWCGFRTS